MKNRITFRTPILIGIACVVIAIVWNADRQNCIMRDDNPNDPVDVFTQCINEIREHHKDCEECMSMKVEDGNLPEYLSKIIKHHNCNTCQMSKTEVVLKLINYPADKLTGFVSKQPEAE